MNPLKIFDLSQEAIELNEFLESLEGDITDHEEFIINWQNRLKDKESILVNGLADLYQTYSSYANAQKEQADRIARLATINTNRAEFLKGILFAYMTRTNQTSVQTDRHRLNLVNNGGVLPLVLNPKFSAETEIRKLPDYFQKLTYSVNTSVIRDCLKSEEQEQVEHDLNVKIEALPDGSLSLLDSNGEEIALQLTRGKHLKFK